MSVASVDRVFPVRILGTVTLAATLVLASAATGTLPILTAIAVAGGTAAAVPAVAMICRSYAIHLMARYGRALPGTCRCGGLFGLGLLAIAGTIVALPLAGPARWPTLATSGLAVAVTLFTAGLLFVPGVAASAVGRLRQAMDGLVIGLSMAEVGWLLMPHVGTAHPRGGVAVVIAAAYASIAAAALLRSDQHRSVTAGCGTGTVLAAVGLALLVVTIGQQMAPWLTLVAAVPAVAGPSLTWAGVRRVDPAGSPARRPRLDETFSGYPVLAVPIGAAVLAYAYHVFVVGLPDEAAVMLGVCIGAALTAREILAGVDLRRFASRIVLQEARLRAVVAGTSDVTVVLDDDLAVRWLSPAAAHQFGLSGDDVVGKPLTDRIHPDDMAAFAEQLRQVAAAGDATGRRYEGPALIEARMRDGAGRWRETESTISDLRSAPEVRALVVQVRDVGQRRTLERAIRRLASTDGRTGLPNRRELQRAITARRGAGNRAGALIVLALYGLAAVNDLEGRSAGDAILVEAARRIRQQVVADELPCRLCESQFAVVTADGPIEAHALAVRLVRALTKPYPLAGRPAVQLQASVGVTGLSGGGGSADEVLRRATLALRQASQLGRNRIEWYDESLEQQLVRRLDVERHLPGAAGRDELDLVYQPVVQLAGGRPVGVVAQLRWRHPVLGTVLPGELLPVADRLRVSSEFAEWALHTACRQVGGWRREGHDVWLAVNVTAAQLTDPDYAPEVAAALSVHQTPPERLIVEISNLEITERGGCAPVESETLPGGPTLPLATGNLPAVAVQLSKLRALGVRTALADFGAGHTDLARLRRLPLDMVKLASSSAAGSAGELAAAVVHLTRRLGLTVVADGLDTEDQRRLVRDAGCRFGQGAVVAPPAPAERIEAYLESQRAPSH